MTYQGIDYNHSSVGYLAASSNGMVRKTAYNLLAVFAVMIAAGIVASAYHPSDSTAISNPRYDSMGAMHAPTAFKGAPPTR
jgi:hypothetical protein